MLIARDGGAALQRLELVVPDAILLDAVMPRLSGFDTCRQIKANPALAHIPVIFMTGLSETKRGRLGIGDAMAPITFAELLAKRRDGFVAEGGIGRGHHVSFMRTFRESTALRQLKVAGHLHRAKSAGERVPFNFDRRAASPCWTSSGDVPVSRNMPSARNDSSDHELPRFLPKAISEFME